MLAALHKVLKSNWTLPDKTSGALLHAAILATEITGWLLCHASRVHECACRIDTRHDADTPRTDECIAGATGPIQFKRDGDRRARSNTAFRVYNHQGMHGLCIRVILLIVYYKYMYIQKKLSVNNAST